MGILGFTQKDVDEILDQHPKLKFFRNESKKYNIAFYHPLYRSWWLLPEDHINVWIHSPWSLLNQGDYGAYELFILSCEVEDVVEYKNKFKTFRDIQKYFDGISEKHFAEVQKQIEKEKKYPPIID